MVKKGTGPPNVLSQGTAEKFLEGMGYRRAKKSKQHAVKMVQDGKPPITLPYHRKGDYGKGLTADILRQAGVKGDSGDERETDESHVPRDGQ